MQPFRSFSVSRARDDSGASKGESWACSSRNVAIEPRCAERKRSQSFSHMSPPKDAPSTRSGEQYGRSADTFEVAQSSSPLRPGMTCAKTPGAHNIPFSSPPAWTRLPASAKIIGSRDIPGNVPGFHPNSKYPVPMRRRAPSCSAAAPAQDPLDLHVPPQASPENFPVPGVNKATLKLTPQFPRNAAYNASNLRFKPNASEGKLCRVPYASRFRGSRPREVTAAETPSLHSSKSWSILFSMGVPLRILIPEYAAGALLNEGGNLASRLQQSSADVALRVLRNTGIFQLYDTVLFVWGASKEPLYSTLLSTCTEILCACAHHKAATLSTPEKEQASIYLLIPERATSMIIGYKGTTINRIAKSCTCDIRLLSNVKPLTYESYCDRILLFRSRELALLVSAMLDVHSLLNDMFHKHKLSEPDFIFALRIASAEQLPGGPASSPSSTSQHGPAHLPGAPLTAALGTGENPVPYEQVPPDTQPLGNRGGALLASHKQPHPRSPWHRFQEGGRALTLDRAVTLPASIPLQPAAFAFLPHLFFEVIHNAKDHVSLKVIISKSHAAWVIGHGGLRKKEIEAIAAATVKVNNNPSDILVDDVRDYRIVLVKGTPVALSKAVNLIIVGYETRERRSANATPSVVRLVMSQASMQCLVNSGQQLLQDVAERSCVSLFVSPVAQSDAQLIHIKGLANQKVSAIMMLLDCLLRRRKRTGFQRAPPVQASASAEFFRSKRRRASEHRIVTDYQNAALELSNEDLKAVGLRCTSQQQKSVPLDAAEAVDGNTATTGIVSKSGSLREPPEASFLRHSVQLTTYPKVITTCTKYTMTVSFEPRYKKLVDELGPDAFHEIEAMVNYRVGSSVQVLHIDPQLCDSTLSQSPQDKAHPNNSSFLYFELKGTPIGNSTAVLLLHEVLMNLDHQLACQKDAASQFAREDDAASQFAREDDVASQPTDEDVTGSQPANEDVTSQRVNQEKTADHPGMEEYVANPCEKEKVIIQHVDDGDAASL